MRGEFAIVDEMGAPIGDAVKARQTPEESDYPSTAPGGCLVPGLEDAPHPATIDAAQWPKAFLRSPSAFVCLRLLLCCR